MGIDTLMSDVSRGVRDNRENIYEANGCLSSIDFENYHEHHQHGVFLQEEINSHHIEGGGP